MEADLVAPRPTRAGPGANTLTSLAHAVVAGNDLTFFLETPPLVDALLGDIRAARQRVWLETYIFLNDAVGARVADALIDRARAGLDVRVLYDAVGSQTTPAAFFRKMEKAGVRVHCFHSFAEALSRWTAVFQVLNRRNHRKLTVVDDRVAYFGGMNLVDTSSASAVRRAERAASSAGWRDVHVRLDGPRQSEVAESFERSWRTARGEKVRRRPRPYRRGFLTSGEEGVQFFDSGPGLKNSRAARVYVRLINAAQKSIRMSMAYFLPVGRVLRALFRARQRGVRIEVVVPGDSDVKVVQYATEHLYRRLLRRGFRIWERQALMLHSKVMVVDDQWTVVGSCNLDARSLWINREFLAVFHSQSLAALLNDMITQERGLSHRVTRRSLAQLSWLRRWAGRCAWSLRWWL